MISNNRKCQCSFVDHWIRSCTIHLHHNLAYNDVIVDLEVYTHLPTNTQMDQDRYRDQIVDTPNVSQIVIHEYI